MSGSDESAVLHVLVVGFHHKKGCQVEYAHPPLMSPEGESKSPEVPSQVKKEPFPMINSIKIGQFSRYQWSKFKPNYQF